jgi:hypothetical protein
MELLFATSIQVDLDGALLNRGSWRLAHSSAPIPLSMRTIAPRRWWQLGLSWIPAARYICLTAAACSLPSRKEMEVEEATARIAPAFASTSKLVTRSITQRAFCVIGD